MKTSRPTFSTAPSSLLKDLRVCRNICSPLNESSGKSRRNLLSHSYIYIGVEVLINRESCGGGGERVGKNRKNTVGCKPTKSIKKCEIFQRGKKILKRRAEQENPIWGRDNSNSKVAQFRSSDKKSKTKQVSTLDYDAIQMPKDVQDRTSIYIMLPLDQVSIDGVLQVGFITMKKQTPLD